MIARTTTDTVSDGLLKAVASSWSGQLVIADMKERQRLGVVVLHRGRIAWAACRDQSENLGDFLLKLGRVSPEQLAPIRDLMRKSGGRRNLGELLEEAGLVRRPMLRHCILLHTRRAIDTLMEYSGASSVFLNNISVRVDEEMTFSFDEVLAGKLISVNQSGPALPSSSRRGVRMVLSSLALIPGYEASAVLKADGEVLGYHSKRDDFDPTFLATCLSSMLEASSSASLCAHFGHVRYVMLDCVRGSLVARWIDEPRRHLVVVLAGKESQIGTIKFELNATIPAIARCLSGMVSDRAAFQ